MAAAALAAIPIASEGIKLAGDLTARVLDELNKPLVKFEISGPIPVGRGKSSRYANGSFGAAIPAWLVVGGAIALWLVGLGIRPGPNGLALVERPRMLLPFTSSSGGSTTSAGIVGGIAGQIACVVLPPPLNLACSALTRLLP